MAREKWPGGDKGEKQITLDRIKDLATILNRVLIRLVAFQHFDPNSPEGIMLGSRQNHGRIKIMKNILIVEDEFSIRESLQTWLMDLGYQVEVAREGEEAMKRIAEKDFDLLILDLRLPGKDGLQVLKEARARKPKIALLRMRPSFFMDDILPDIDHKGSMV